MNRLGRILCVFLLSVSSLAVAQSLGTGLYKFGSFDSPGFDSINIGNLNTHFEIPIVSKQGRGLPFNYSLVYEGLIWSPVSSGGTSVWQSDPNWGFHGQLFGGFTGYSSHSISTIRCSGPIQQDGPPPIFGFLYANYVYHDPYGRNHAFDYTDQECDGAAPVITGDGSTSDGSGFSYGGPGLQSGNSDGLVHTKTGLVINAPTFLGTQANGSITDSNGNVVTNNGNGTFTDTLGVTALTIGGSGSQASPLTLTYPVTHQADSATMATATVYYKNYTAQTNFHCAITESGATSVDLVDHITLADGSSTYSFSYEVTPGIPGSVTGRLASITLPTGGTITYSYSGGCNGSGINPDGTVAILTRTTTDPGSRTYTTSSVNPNATSTMVQDEKGNHTLYNFSIYNGLFYETQREVYQGAVGGPNLLSVFTCYNGATLPCDGATVAPPFTQTQAVISYNNGAQDSVVNTYDASQMQIGSVKSWWGSSAQLIQSFFYTPQQQIGLSETWDGSNNLIEQTSYGYDETAPITTSGIPQHSVITGTPGNQTSSGITVGFGTGAPPPINTTTAYYDTGVPVSTTTPNGTTQFSYDPAQTFATTTTLPTPSSGVSLATSASYDPQSGVQISATGLNAGQTAQYTQYDRLLRPTVTSLPNGGQVFNYYVGSNETGVTQPMGNGQNAISWTLNDAYGRTSRVAVYNAQSSNPWYQVDYCYDATGLLQFQSAKYQGGGFDAPKQCTGNGTSYSYDALGRMTSQTNADGTTTNQYNGRAVLTTDVNGVRKIVSHDLLGRISDICEVSSSNLQGESPQPCPGDIAGYTGFVTHYAYNLANHQTQIMQGAQARTFTTDAAGRVVSTIEPERGTTTYSYAYGTSAGCPGAGLCVTRTRPKANPTNQTTVTHTVTQYDSLGRVVSVSYDDGVTPNKQFDYDAVNSTLQWTQTPTNIKGMMADMSSGSGTSLTRGLFSYDLMGNVTTMWQCAPFYLRDLVSGRPSSPDLFF
jgi:hypothetical protein